MRFLVLFAIIALASCQSTQDDKNSTTTAPPKTTTHDPPKTTTEKPKTTTAPPKTTTEAPKTTTSAPTTTPMPTPGPRKNPVTVSYNITEKKDNETITCLKVDMAAQIVVTYNNTAKKSETAYINLKNTTTVNKSSYCKKVDEKNVTQSLLVLDINGVGADQLSLVVVQDKSQQYVKTIKLVYKPDSLLPLFPAGKNIDVSQTDLSMFKSSKDKSYRCDSKEEETLSNKNDTVLVVLDVNNVRFDAFRENNSTGFRSAEVCQADDQVSDIVPIAVGIALAALVVIVLIAYFIGRRRSRRLAYQSV